MNYDLDSIPYQKVCVEVGVRWGAERPPPNGASFPPGRARGGGPGPGFLSPFARPFIRTFVFSLNSSL